MYGVTWGDSHSTRAPGCRPTCKLLLAALCHIGPGDLRPGVGDSKPPGSASTKDLTLPSVPGILSERSINPRGPAMAETKTTVDRRTAIVDAAVKVFAAHGFDAGTIRQIAREAGVAEGLIYHYFENKEALLYAVIQDRSMIAWLRRPDALPDDAPIDAALHDLVTEALGRMADNIDLVAVIWSQVATNPKLAQVLGRALREMTDRISGYLDRKVARGELREINTVAAARMIAGSMMAFTIQQHRLSPPLKLLSPDDYAAAIVDLLVSGMIARDGEDSDDDTE